MLVQRGFVILILLLSAGATLLFVSAFSSFVQPRFAVAAPVGVVVGVGFGVLLVVAGVKVEKRITARIDRAFFRSAYDARLILQELAEKARTASSRQELAGLLEDHLNQALHPSSLAIYLESGQNSLDVAGGQVPARLETIPTTLPVLAELARRARP